MQRFVRALALALVVGLLAASGALAAPGPQLNFGAQLNAGQCRPGTLVINVVQQVTNDADSAVGGTYWALDNVTRQIQVWQTGSDTFCATVRYEGSFTTFAGPSPNATGTVSAGITGTIHGGYLATFEGTLSTDPQFATHGNIGSIDYQCDSSGNCPGYVDWVDAYFPGYTGFAQPWWGWIYRTPHHGTWVNSSDGNRGDITG